jgi:hypothetical protein
VVIYYLENVVVFSYQDVVNGLKSLSEAVDTPANLSHCQALEFQARKLGFKSFHHFRESLNGIPQDSFAAISLGLMRRICEKRLPSLNNSSYYEFVPLPNGVGYYSHWIGWDKFGEEVRVPRPLEGKTSVKKMREAVEHPIYVLESERELIAWQAVWRSTAYVPEELAKANFPKSFNKQHLVSENPPLDLIKRKIRDYSSNFAAN